MLATGLKGAYGHAVDAEGRIWTTEIGDDPIDDGAPPDELNLVVTGADFGWPQCAGSGEPVQRYDGTPERCRAEPGAGRPLPAQRHAHQRCHRAVG